MVRNISIATLLVCAAPMGLAAQAASGTDIWVFRVTGPSPTVDLTSGTNVTRRPGYDNQPHFPPGESLLLYTAADSAGQADVWSYDLRSGARRNLTRSSPESEYSPTVMPSLERFSVIRVEADSTQRLWSFESGGTNPEVILPSVQPVGYHAWVDQDRLALFVLGSPATLQMASVSEGTASVVAENIGRSVHRIPGRGTVSFVQLDEDGIGWIREYDPETGSTRPLAPAVEGNEFHAWTPDGTLVAGRGSKLFRWVPGEAGSWEEMADLEIKGLQGISRIAFSPGGGWVAVVGMDNGGQNPGGER